MSEKRVCSASRSFAPLIGLFAAPNRPRNAPNSKIPLRKPLFQADSMRLWRIHSAKGAFTLSIDPMAHPRFIDPSPIFMKRDGRMPPVPSNPKGTGGFQPPMKVGETRMRPQGKRIQTRQ